MSDKEDTNVVSFEDATTRRFLDEMKRFAAGRGSMASIAAELIETMEREMRGEVLTTIEVDLTEAPFTSKLQGLTFKDRDYETAFSGFRRLEKDGGVGVYDRNKLCFTPTSDVMLLVRDLLDTPAAAVSVTFTRADEHDPEGNHIYIKTTSPEKVMDRLKEFADYFSGLLGNIRQNNDSAGDVDPHRAETHAPSVLKSPKND